MAESRNKLVYLVLDELNRPISLGGMEDGDTISDDLLSTEVRNAASGFDGVSATVYDNSATWDEGIDPATLADLVTASSRTDTLVTFSASVETSTADLATSTTDISGYIDANKASWAAGIDAGTLIDIGSVSATVKDSSGGWNDTYAVIAGVSANHFLSSVDGVSLLDGNLEIGTNKTISSIGSYTLSANNIITLAPGGNLNLSSDSNVRLVPNGDVKIQPTGSAYISGVGVTLESDDGNFSIGTNGGTTTVYDLVTVLDDAIDTKASAIALNIWSGTVDTSVVDLDADITTLDGRVVAVESLVPSAAGFADWNATKATVDAGAANWDTAYTTDLFPSAAGFANWDTAYTTDLFPSAAGFADWNATKDTVDAGAADWDGAYASALTASAYILDNEAAWLAGSDNPSGTASAMGVYLGSSVAISGFGPGDATPTGPIANQYLAFKASDSRFRYVEPPLRFTTTDQVSINPLGMLDLEGGGGTANSFGLDIGLSLSGWVNQNDYDITVTPGLPNSYTIDIDFDQSQQQTANLTAVSANGSTLGINFSNISAGRKVNLTILNPTYTITTIPVIAGATWMTTSLSNLAAGETVEIIIYSRGSTTSDLYLYSTQLDHGELQGLLDDDHTQYYNDTRLQAELAGTSFPGTPYDGQPFFRTDLDDNFWYDSTRSKWLGGPRNHTLGFTANLVLNAYMKHAGNVTGAATAGEPMVYDSTLVGWSYCVNAAAAGSFELYVNGSATGITISHASSTTGNDQTVNYNLAANDIVTVRNVSGASVAAPVINLIIKRRAS
jgi:hypothetical protein